MYLERIRKFKGNEFTAFGTSIHDVCEKVLLDESVDMEAAFLASMEREETSLQRKGVEIDEKFWSELKEQGIQLTEHILPAVKNYFGLYKVVSTEEQLMEPAVVDDEYKFKGFIDLVVQTDDGKYHIIDWKSCSWGWDLKKKTDPMITYQLTLYKYYFAQKHNIDPKMIETHFALLKRTAKEKHVEIFRVTSGPRKTRNVLTLLQKAIYNIKAKTHIKNRLSCYVNRKCEFCHTSFCTR
jgi:ATP-dependent exoDNAse (exonuclease V) beta subunit